MTKKAVGGTRPGGAYSPGIMAEGRFVYVAGQVPMRDGVLTGESTGEQTKVVIENLASVLAKPAQASPTWSGAACSSQTWATLPR